MNARIKAIRKTVGLNQTEFGARIGVKQTTIAGYETGASTPMDAVISSICREFNVDEHWLRTGEGDMFDQSYEQAETARMIESISDSPAMRSLLATWAQLSDENKAVFERFAADYVDDYMRRKAEAETARAEAMLDDAEPGADQKQA